MSLLQKYRKDETRKTSPEEEKRKKEEKDNKKPIAKKETKTSKKKIKTGQRSRPVISATVSLELVEILNRLTEEKYLNRSKFIEDALIRTIKTEFPDFAKKNNM